MFCSTMYDRPKEENPERAKSHTVARSSNRLFHVRE
jgi:hypothetical protein